MATLYDFQSIEDAQNKWQYLDQAGKDAAHQYVKNAKAGSGATYDPVTGRWSDQNYGGQSTSSLKPVNTQKKETNNQDRYYVPYQQSYDDAISKLSYTRLTDREIEDRARNMADLQINPQVTSLQASLQKAIADAANQKRSIEANYSTIGPTAERLLANAQKAGTESAIARGGGRSGAVEYEVGRLREPINESVMQAENRRAAELTNIDNALGTVNTNYSDQMQALEAQRGQLVAAQIAALKAGDMELALDLANKRATHEYNRSALYDSANQNFADRELRTHEIYGGAPGITGTVTLTDYVTQRGLSAPSWDASTGNITLNGKTYTPDQLKNAGGYLQNGRWQLPESVVASMMQ